MRPESGIGRQAHPAAVYLLLLPRQAERMRRVFRPGSIWKQEELAERVNISREHLGRLERGKYGCSIDLLIELSFTLNASTDYLLLGCRPERDQDRKQLLRVISQLSDIARNM